MIKGGWVRLRHDRLRQDIAIDLTPFIDVVLMLLLFFVVSTSYYNLTDKLKLTLPVAHAEGNHQDKKEKIEISVDATGSYYLGNEKIGNHSQQLKTALQGKIKNKENAPLVLMGDKVAPHQSIVSVLEVASELGVTQIEILIQPTLQENSE